MGPWRLGGEMRLLRKRCERQLADLPLPSPFSLMGLVAEIEAARGCQVHLVPVSDAHGDMRTACGLRVTVERLNSTFILYRPRPTPNQTEHVIIHEIAHLWFGHGKSLTPQEEQQLLPPLFQEFLADVREDSPVVQARAHYESHEERQAELSASLIKRLARQQAALGTDLISVMEASLTHPLAPPRGRRP
ncbi:hypothetical protein ACTPOK_09485 [Streptomyces inhibens]|uniref:hypothetical protein n=1 Tax=Streptomyces inhibens TaxID=2293571 RepID=UPI00402AEA36